MATTEIINSLVLIEKAADLWWDELNTTTSPSMIEKALRILSELESKWNHLMSELEFNGAY